jgi:hypothetical protein
MADIAPTPSLPPPPPPQQTYRPVAALAIAGFALAAFSGIVFILDTPWLVAMLPAPALIISVMARSRIRRSEGTLAGYTLAGLGVAISIVIILVYITVNTTKYWIVRNESRDFVERWLVKMREGKEGLAFLDTAPPDSRHVTFPLTDIRRLRARFPSPANPDESMFDIFRKHQLTGALLRYKDRVSWQYVSMDEMKYNLGSYSIKHRYLLTTPEVTGQIVFALRSDEMQTPSGPRREWRLEIQGCLPPPSPPAPPAQYTAHGEMLRDMEREAGKALRRCLGYISEGKLSEAQALLGATADDASKADFARLYEALRRDAKPTVPAKLVPKTSASLLLRDINEGKAWALDYEGVIETGNREVEFRFRIETDDPAKGPESWRLTWIKFLGEHKKPVAEQRLGPGGQN